MKTGVCVGMLCLVSLLPVCAADEAVHFVDQNLQREVERALGIKLPLQSEMLALKTLEARNKGIADLTGLEWAVNLTSLKLGENRITEVSPLAGLTGLQVLDLHTNQIEDINALSDLTGLVDLNLSRNRISNVRVLSSMAALTKLDLSQNAVAEIDSLSHLTQLSELLLSDNRISSAAPLVDLTTLTILSLDNNSVRDVASLSRMTELRRLYLAGNGLADISGLAVLTQLEVLSLDSNRIVDITPLSSLMSLINVSLRKNGLVNLSGLGNQPALTHLSLNDNRISDVSTLASLTNVKYLWLGNNQVSDLGPLRGMAELQYLEMRNNRVRNLDGLSHMPKLFNLWLPNNQVEDINGLADCTVLTELCLDDNAVTDIRALAGKPGLKTLRLANNRIRDISPLVDVSSLTYLHLGGNQISDLFPLSWLWRLETLILNNNQITDLTSLQGLTRLMALWLNNNPVNDLSPLCRIPLKRLERLHVQDAPLSAEAYCTDLPRIQQNNPGVILVYSPNPRPPAGLTVSRGTARGRVLLQWDAVCNGPAYMTHYQVYRARLGTGEKTAINGWVVGTTFEDATAAPETVYSYWVKASADAIGSGETEFSQADAGWCAGIRRTLTVSATAGGTVAVPGQGPVSVNYGDSVPLSARAAENYIFAGWTGTAVDAGKVNDPANADTVAMVEGDYSVRATFVTLLDTIHVDDDAPTDPGPKDLLVSDPHENGTTEHPFDSVQEAMEVAVSATTILVARGVYHERIDFLGKDILLIGESGLAQDRAEGTTLDGDNKGPVVTFSGGETAACVLSNVIITRGKGVNGGGIRCAAASSPTIRGCTISDNFAMRGGGVYFDGGTGLLSNCVIGSNFAVGGGGLYCDHADPRVLDSTVLDNAAVRGGGLYADGASPVLSGDSIKGNWAGCGGGLYCTDSDVHVSDGLLRGNTPSFFCVGMGMPPEIVNSELGAEEPADCSTYCETIDEFWGKVMTAENPDETEVMRFLISPSGAAGAVGTIP